MPTELGSGRGGPAARGAARLRGDSAVSTASSRPGKRSLRSSLRSDSIRVRPSGRVRTTPDSRSTRKWMRERRLREAEVERAAGALVADRELADYLKARRVAQCVEHVGELELRARWVMGLSHRTEDACRRNSSDRSMDV